MSREFPDILNPWKTADGKRVFQGTMPLRRMKRLRELLAEGLEWPDAEFSAAFGRDEQGTVTVELQVIASLPLVCQRSLLPYLENVERHSTLAVIEDMAEQEQVPGHYDPVLVEHGRMALQDLVEDELLLAVPQVPRNPLSEAVDLSTDGEAELPPVAEDEQTHRPFEGLAGLMKDKAGK